MYFSFEYNLYEAHVHVQPDRIKLIQSWTYTALEVLF